MSALGLRSIKFILRGGIQISYLVVLVVGGEGDLLGLVVDSLPLLALRDADGAQVAPLPVEVQWRVLGRKALSRNWNYWAETDHSWQ